tara:strand:- start:3262 stop:4356 length:1095 start_codon:yes stop_codon:yes gene_type:complete
MNSILPHSQQPRIGVMLVNLGTPAAPEAAAIRRYLKQFLSDPRVVELPRWLWKPILHGFILPFRPRKLVEAYSKVWGEDGSPLLSISKQQVEALQAALGETVVVDLAMTYGEPSVQSSLERLQALGAQKILFLPMYPQYSGTTTAAAFDALAVAMRKQRWIPEIRTINCYHDHDRYIEALADSVNEHWQARGRADHFLISFHSIPRKYLEMGDPYYCQCQKTARLLADKLKLGSADFSVSFQSRLGRQPWLQPYTDLVIPQLAAKGNKRLDVICPGFSVDCLETLEEVAIRYSEAFSGAGGEELRYIPALNAGAAHIQMLKELTLKHLHQWQAEETTADELKRRQIQVDAFKPTLNSPTLMPEA